MPKGHDGGLSAAALGREYPVLFPIPRHHGIAAVFNVVQLAVVPNRPLRKMRIGVQSEHAFSLGAGADHDRQEGEGAACHHEITGPARSAISAYWSGRR